jgi:hypothetical protein
MATVLSRYCTDPVSVLPWTHTGHEPTVSFIINKIEIMNSYPHDLAEGLDEVLGRLERHHGVVAFPGLVDGVVGDEGGESRVGAVPVPAC